MQPDLSDNLLSDSNSNDETPSQVPVRQKAQNEWKPAKNKSFETIALVATKNNQIVRPCGFQTNGRPRKVKKTCLISRMRTLAFLKDKRPQLCVCITMYNENEAELKTTLSGVLQNYNVMFMNEGMMLRQEDIVIVCVCDGFDKIPESFKKYATSCGFFDEQILRDKGFME